LSIAQNTALFSLLGTQYGGNGTSTFALPNLQSRVPVHQGTGPGLSNYVIGEVTGTESVTLNQNQMPIHNHQVSAFGSDGTSGKVAGKFLSNSGTITLYNPTSDGTTMAPQMVANAGGNQPFPVLQPLLVVNFCIALQGIFPSRN
jgi:microcystin-dependent protein